MNLSPLDYNILKTLQKSHSDINIESLADKCKTNTNRIYTLINNGYIASNRPPIMLLDDMSPVKPLSLSITEAGSNIIDDYDAERRDRLEWLLRDKALNIIVSIVVAFITSIVTYFLIPYIQVFFTRM